MASIEEKAIDGLVTLLRMVATRARVDVVEKLHDAAARETSSIAKEQFSCLLENVDLGITDSRPYCQDTGTIQFFVSLGDHFPVRARLKEVLAVAIQRATLEIPLRPNTVDPVDGRNFGGNSGPCMPDVHVDLVPGSSMSVTVMLKGGGAENMSRLFMINPIDGINAIPGLVRDAVIEAGGKPCPPVIIGIGIGGTASTCMLLGKKALLRDLGAPHPNPDVAALETRILHGVNATRIGAMGLGGDTTCLAVHVETCARHPASFPIGMVMQCHAHRHGTITVDGNGEWTIVEAFS